MNIPKILSKETELRGRKTTMEIVTMGVAGGSTFKYEIVHRPEAAVAIVKTFGGHYIFIKQYRIPVTNEIVEAVAGCLEWREDPADCIKREVEEETGYRVSNVEPMASFYASPGYSDEIIHSFDVTVFNDTGSQRLDDEERIRVMRLGLPEIRQMLKDGKLNDGKTLIAWYEHCRRNGISL